MNSRFVLHAVDWLIIGVYMLLALAVGFAMQRRAQFSKSSGMPGIGIGQPASAQSFASARPMVVKTSSVGTPSFSLWPAAA